MILGWPFPVVTGQGTWEKLDVPTDHFLKTVHFTDSLYGWAAGNGGVIIRTTDGGNNWVIQDSQTDYDISDIVFLNRNYGWASAHNFTSSPYGTVLLKTYDGGENWISEQYPQENIFINCILFLDSLDIWMGGSPHALVRSSDGGTTWNQAVIDTSILAFFPVLSIKFYNENYGYACGGMFEVAGVIWRTSDGGQTWYAIDPQYAPADEVHELHLYDSLTVIGSGGDPDFGYGVAFIRTEDGGLTWQYEELGLPGNSYDLDFRTDEEAWAPLGQRKQLIYSLDGGETWEATATPDSTAIFDIIFPDSLHGYAVGMQGAMLKYKCPVGVSSDPEEKQLDLTNLTTYPNPFTGRTLIKFRVTNSGFQEPGSPYGQCMTKPGILVNLTIYNAYGSLIRTLLNDYLSPGVHEVPFEAGGLAPGIYYCRLRSSSGSITTRMILLP